MPEHSLTFNYTGSDQTWTVPDHDTGTLVVTLAGGAGGDSGSADGGKPGYIKGTLTLAAGTVITIKLGDRGDHGPDGGAGGAGPLPGGDGGSGLFTGGGGGSGSELWDGATLIAAAAGGGGASRRPFDANEQSADGAAQTGSGGDGTPSTATSANGQGGRGATTSAAGAGGDGATGGGSAGSAGSGGAGGDGAGGGTYGAGGGGGGYYGAGGGGGGVGGGSSGMGGGGSSWSDSGYITESGTETVLGGPDGTIGHVHFAWDGDAEWIPPSAQRIGLGWMVA